MPRDELSVPISEGRFRERRAYLSPEAFADPGDGDHTSTNPDRPSSLDGPDGLADGRLATDDRPLRLHLPGHAQHLGHVDQRDSAQRNRPVADPRCIPRRLRRVRGSPVHRRARVVPAGHCWPAERTRGDGPRRTLRTPGRANCIRGVEGRHSGPPKFQNSVELISGRPSVAAVEPALPEGALFGRNPDGVLRALYQELCRLAHGGPGHTNVDIWESSGPSLYRKRPPSSGATSATPSSHARSFSSSLIPAWSGQLIFQKSPPMLGRRGTGSHRRR